MILGRILWTRTGCESVRLADDIQTKVINARNAPMFDFISFIVYFNLRFLNTILEKCGIQHILVSHEATTVF